MHASSHATSGSARRAAPAAAPRLYPPQCTRAEQCIISAHLQQGRQLLHQVGGQLLVEEEAQQHAVQLLPARLVTLDGVKQAAVQLLEGQPLRGQLGGQAAQAGCPCPPPQCAVGAVQCNQCGSMGVALRR